MVVGIWEFMTMRSPLNFNGIEGIVSFLFGCLSKIFASLHFAFHFVNYTQRGNNSTNACIYHSLSDVLFCSMSCRTSWYLIISFLIYLFLFEAFYICCVSTVTSYICIFCKCYKEWFMCVHWIHLTISLCFHWYDTRTPLFNKWEAMMWCDALLL
jgi:hypothetical protein